MARLAASQKLLNSIHRAKVSLAKLGRLWDRRNISWDSNVEFYRQAAQGALDLGEGFLAFNIAEHGLSVFVDDLRLLQIKALALARTGSAGAANQVLLRLERAGHHDEETLGLMARTHKDLWKTARNTDKGNQHLKKCRQLYLKAFRDSEGYYSGINAATVSLLLGKTSEAHRLAGQVLFLCTARLQEDAGGESYWLTATQAEAFLIRGDIQAAERAYRRAVNDFRPDPVVMSSTRAQARLLLEAQGEAENRLDDCFELPCVAAFAGHMFDAPGRKQPRFPARYAKSARRDIDELLAQRNVRVGFSALACGGDLLFAEALLETGGELHIVLPFERGAFRRSSVDLYKNSGWGRRYQSALSKAASVTILNPHGNPDDSATFEFCNRVILGLARLKARSMGVDLLPIALWDGLPGDGGGGTDHFVEISSVLQKPVIVDVRKYLPTPAKRGRAKKGKLSQQAIRAILFADVVGFSRLTEGQVPTFVETFFGAVAAAFPQGKQRPLYRNTWGDALYCVFRGVSEAGEFALTMREVIQKTRWEDHGLPKGLNVRIGLHAGPVFECYDPIIGRQTFSGYHVNCAARIEPITEEGQIFASQSFAALSACKPSTDFQCDYAGMRKLPKRAGVLPVFILRRKTV